VHTGRQGRVSRALVPQAQAADPLKDGRTPTTLKDAAQLILMLPESHQTWVASGNGPCQKRVNRSA
jgi:hypothetical protein